MRHLLVYVLLAACGGDPAPASPAPADAHVAAEPPQAAAAKPLADGSLPVDLTRSKIGWTAQKLVGSNAIALLDYAGSVRLDGDQVVFIAYTGQMASMEADQPKLTTHLKNEDFFDVAKHPESTFQSTAVVAGSDVDGFTHTVTGDLTVMGITKSITFPAKIAVTPTEVTANAAFVLDRRDFHLVYPGMPDNLIQDAVPMEITLVAPR